MPRLVATVTRQASADKPFFARMADGGNPGGPFQNVAKAKRGVQQSVGGLLLRWVQDDNIDGVETYTAFDGTPAPDSFAGLIEWQDARYGVIKRPLTEFVQTWGDISLNGHKQSQPTPNRQPTFVPYTSGPNNRPSLQFDPAVIKNMASILSITMNSYTLVVIARADAPTGVANRAALCITSATGPVTHFVGLNAAGNWVGSNGTPIVGPAAVPGILEQLTYVQSPTGARFYFNGNLVSTNLTAGTTLQSAIAGIGQMVGQVNPWNGYISAAQIFDRPLTPGEVAQLSAINRADWGTE